MERLYRQHKDAGFTLVAISVDADAGKIGPFLTWLHRYGPVAGLQQVPMLEQMYSRRLALLGWAAWTTGLVLGATIPLTSAEWIPPGAAVSLSTGGAITIVNAVRVGRHLFR